MNDSVLGLIEQYRLVVRPSLFGKWVVGVFKGVMGDGKVCVISETMVEHESLKIAIELGAIKAIKYKRCISEIT